jgi:ABC-type nitrate/sulfonate/bicarbonate transport system substrate-binding protein
MFRKIIILAGAVLVFFVISSALLSGESVAQEKLTIRIGTQPVLLPELITQLYGTLGKKFGDKYNIKWIEFTHAGPGFEAMAAGEVDFFDAGVTPSIQGKEKGRDYWAVGISGANVTGMVVRKDLGIKSPKDLKGKKIAYPGAGSWQLANLLMALEKGGLNLNDVELYRARFPEMPILLKNKTIDGYVGVEPFMSLSVFEGDAEMLFYPPIDLSGFILVLPAFAKANPKAVTDLLREFNTTAKWIRSQPEKAAEEFSKIFKGTITKEVIRYAMRRDIFVEDLTPNYDYWIKFIELTNKYKLTDIKDIEKFVKDLIHPEFAKKM